MSLFHSPLGSDVAPQVMGLWDGLWWRRTLTMIFHLLRHWEPVRCGSSDAILAQ